MGSCRATEYEISREKGDPCCNYCPSLPSLSRLSLPTPCWLKAFSSPGEGRGLEEIPSGSEVGGRVPGWYKSLPPLTALPKSRKAPGVDPQSGPRPSGPFPLFPRISGGGPGSARSRTFFAKKGKDAAARAAGTSGSDSRHEWVMAPPPRDSGAGAGICEGGWPPKWGDGAERCTIHPVSDAPGPCSRRGLRSELRCPTVGGG